MQLGVPQKYAFINRSSLLLWTAITLLFIYERTYLIQKVGLPHLIDCVVVRVSLLLLLCYVHNEGLVPRLLARKKYVRYGLLTSLSVGIYVFMQGLYDHYLFGYVIGDQQRAGLWLNLPYNLLVTGWYLLLTYLVRYGVQEIGAFNQPNSSSQATEPIHTDSTDNGELVIKTGTQWVRLTVADIRYAQGLKDYTTLYTHHNKYLVKGSLGKVADWLPDGQFIRVHKSYLVARRHIKAISATQISLEGQIIPVGRAYATTALETYK